MLRAAHLQPSAGSHDWICGVCEAVHVQSVWLKHSTNPTVKITPRCTEFVPELCCPSPTSDLCSQHVSKPSPYGPSREIHPRQTDSTACSQNCWGTLSWQQAWAGGCFLKRTSPVKKTPHLFFVWLRRVQSVENKSCAETTVTQMLNPTALMLMTAVCLLFAHRRGLNLFFVSHWQH